MSSHDESEPGEGNSPAAWTAVVIMLVAFSIGTVAFFFSVAWVVWAAVVLLFLGIITGAVLARMGYGVGGSRHKTKAT